ncbi:OmpA family protein [Paraclostridium bifermentans]|uniref:OmpA/MotB family protein n=1 Tax=Paraclostridium bifermentans TaxID=1490 RepID=UPI001F2A1A20|nr:OmpA family protein [Paraclostridium bifermentans]MCE9675736.1 OmpA family protein [Paraclostridium bifermentans]MCR1876268.1 OmpA family protein [Paraclostridium bifermentans]MCU9808911.1 OmpA family protein [Paraclostridium sp. AKS46]
MKIRSRKYKTTAEEQSYWPSFVDIMTTVSLVFFFIMIVSSGINKMFVDNIVDKRQKLYDSIQAKLDDNNVDKNIISFDKEKGTIAIKTETFFDQNKSELKQDGINVANILSPIFYELLSDKQISPEIDYIEVVGHTDYIGNTIDNRRLSTERAMSFLDTLVPMNSSLENDYGQKFKASGMSEFESNANKEERDRTEYNDEVASKQRKIEIRMIFSDRDIEDAVKLRSK